MHPGSELLSRLRRQPRRTRCSARPSCSSTTSCARTGACSSCSRADYTFVNERLARHYGIPDVSGSEFRRVEYPDDTRRGLLGHGSMLVQTSLANRTSPVLRGKWVMEVLLGTPPPPPPPDVPTLEETADVEGRQAADDARADGDAPREPDVQLLPPVHGSDRPRARQLRRDRRSGAIRENGMPLDTRATSTTARRSRRRPSCCAALTEAPGAAGPDLHREPDGLRAGPARRVLRPADDPRDRAGRPRRTDYRMSSFILGVVKSDAFQMKRAEPVSTDDAKR